MQSLSKRSKIQKVTPLICDLFLIKFGNYWLPPLCIIISVKFHPNCFGYKFNIFGCFELERPYTRYTWYGLHVQI